MTTFQSFLTCICILCFILMLKGAFNKSSNNDSPFFLNGDPNGDEINLN